MALLSGLAVLALAPEHAQDERSWQPLSLSMSLDVVDSLDQLVGLPKALRSQLTVQMAVPGQVFATIEPTARSPEDAWEFWRRFALENAHLKGLPALCRLKSSARLTAPDAIKQTLFYKLELEPRDHVPCCPGDSFGILPPNPDALVCSLLARLGCHGPAAHQAMKGSKGGGGSGEDPGSSPATALPFEWGLLKEFHVGLCSLSYYELFKYAVDLCSFPKKSLFRYFADHCHDTREKKYLYYLSARQGSDDYMKLREQRPCLLDLLHAFPSCQPPVTGLIEFLPPQPVRYYSVASSFLVHPDTLAFCFSVPEPVGAPRRAGLCSGWLASFHADSVMAASQRQSVYLPVVFRKTRTLFSLPAAATTPLILVCAGTGIAPFIGFLEHRSHQKMVLGEPTGPIWLFFGCRHAERDYLFEKELSDFKANGVLAHVSVCCSRDAEAKSGKKHYVQHDLRLYACEIYRMMAAPATATSAIAQAPAVLFVCGDANRMFCDVHDMLLSIVQSEGQLTLPEAQKTVAEWIESKRYLREVWSS